MDFENEQVVLLAFKSKTCPLYSPEDQPLHLALGHGFESSVRQLKKVFTYYRNVS